MDDMAILAVAGVFVLLCLGAFIWLPPRYGGKPRTESTVDSDAITALQRRVIDVEATMKSLTRSVDELPAIWSDHAERIKKQANRAAHFAKKVAEAGQQDGEPAEGDVGDGEGEQLQLVREGVDEDPEITALRRQIALGG